MTLGEKLRQTRLARGLTQKQLAGDHITRNMLSQLEHDQAKPSMRTLEYLAETLGVEPGWLMSRDDGTDTQADMEQARVLLREGAFAACYERLGTTNTDEALLMRSICARELAEQALHDEHFSTAKTLALQALEENKRCLYPDAALQIAAARIAARCSEATDEESQAEASFEAYRQTYLHWQTGVLYHLTLARYALEHEHIQAAEREIWSIAELPDENRVEYLILRGRIAAKKEQYENAILYLRQAEEHAPPSRLLRRELLSALERCYRETEQYKLAYETATAQREL